MQPQKQVCTCCQRERFLSDFSRDAKQQNGRRSECRECRAKKRSKANNVPTQIAAIEAGLLETLDRLSSGGSTLPHTTELAEAAFQCFGGPQGFMKQMFATYAAAPPGSLARVRILQSILDLTVGVSESGHATPALEHMTDEELTAEVMRQHKRLIASGMQKLGIATDQGVVDVLPIADEPATISDSTVKHLEALVQKGRNG